jgi:hypothetical protein
MFDYSTLIGKCKQIRVDYAELTKIKWVNLHLMLFDWNGTLDESFQIELVKRRYAFPGIMP